MSVNFSSFEQAVFPAIQAGSQSPEDEAGFRFLFTQLKRYYKDETLSSDIISAKNDKMITLIDPSGRFIQTDLVNTMFGRLRGLTRAIDEHGLKQTQTKLWS